MTIKEMRTKKELTQEKASKLVGIPLRTFKDYENNPNRIGTIKYNYILEKLSDYGNVDKEHGILDIYTIKRVVKRFFADYNLVYCYLFGSYAKETPNSSSDINLFIYDKDNKINKIKVESSLEEILKKKVEINIYDMRRHSNILMRDILNYGIKII
ncbi:MAG: nucleotidyltransferase domain-containing protein [Acholeplasmatales bacterium]|nr:nucleotidyltransferase domain-containing protein [Acholeplasmatales bacterium]